VVTSTVEKLIGAENVKKLADACGAKSGDLVVAVSDQGQTRARKRRARRGPIAFTLGEALGAIDKSNEILWLTGFPLFEWSESDKTWVSGSTFTGIVDEDLEKLEAAPGKVRSKDTTWS